MRTVSFSFPAYWVYFQGNDYHPRIKKIILRRPNGSYPNGSGHIFLDNVQFTPITTVSPVGTLESVSIQDNAAVGWSDDPDNQAGNNFVDCSIDGQFAGRVTANLSGAGGPYPGNHRFSFPIPMAYRDGQNHQISCAGIDLVGGDPNKILAGSPKSFNIPTQLVSTTFVPVTPGELSLNNNPGGGLRIFPERLTPTGPVRNVVNVKTKIGVNVANVPVYFRSFDLDDPSATSPPVDVDDALGRDNRAASPWKAGKLCAGVPPGCTYDSATDTYRVLTNANGEATIPFELTGAHPGDNYAVSASTIQSEATSIFVDGINLRNSGNGELLQENVKRTPMITAWRTLHIERDSMGAINNEAETTLVSEHVTWARPITVPVIGTLDPGRFENGRIRIGGGKELFIRNNDSTSLKVWYLYRFATLFPGIEYKLCDDDDFNSDNSLNGFDCDQGEYVQALPDTFNLLQPNDDADCGDSVCNVFAPAYIQPSFLWGDVYSNSDVQFVQNVFDTPSEVTAQVDRGRNLNSGENDEFWVAYVQIAYQHSTDQDCDPNVNCTSGITRAFCVNDVTNAAAVPSGGQGSLLYIEVMRDWSLNLGTDARMRTAPHEVGHQFGLLGDNSESPPANFGIMNPIGPPNLVNRRLNIIRTRKKSPGA